MEERERATGDARPDDGSADTSSLSLEGSTLAPIGRILPAKPWPFLALVVAVSAGAWLVGLALTPDRPRFLASPEWRFMPLYLAAHLVAVRLFVSSFTRNYLRGAMHLDVPEETALRGVRLVLGLPGVAMALAVAAPFAWLDYRYLTGAGSRYDRMGPEGSVSIADLWMWGTWCVEWFLNALIWVMLLGFLIKNCAMIRSYPFRAPIEIVVHERHYRPFLQMSAEGASIVLGFSAVTIFYLWYTGGELTDYAGLAITAALLFIGFVPPWLLLRHKVRRAVELETAALRNAMAHAIWRDKRRLAGTAPTAGAAGDAAAGGARPVDADGTKGGKPAGGAASGGAAGAGVMAAPSLEQRLEEALAIFRVSYLEHLKVNLGGQEARAILVRLVAPALGIAWQLTANHQTLVPKLEGALKAASDWLGKLGLW